MTNFTNITNEQLNAALDAEAFEAMVAGVETTDLLDALFEERSRRIKALQAENIAEEAKAQAELIEASGAVKIQKKNGRTLYFDGESYIMNGPTGTHTLAASETCFERLAAHWSGFSGAKNNEVFALGLKKAIVKAFLFRSDHKDETFNNHFRGGIEMQGTCFDLGVRTGRGFLNRFDMCLAACDVTTHFTPHGNVDYYTVSVEWNRSDNGQGGTTPGGIYNSDAFPCFVGGEEVPARTARAAAEAHLVEHILETVASAKITLAQIVGVEA